MPGAMPGHRPTGALHAGLRVIGHNQCRDNAIAGQRTSEKR